MPVIFPNSLDVSSKLLGGVTGGIAGTGVSYGPVFMCVACGKKWSSSAPAKCSCGALVVDSNTNAALFYEKVKNSHVKDSALIILYLRKRITDSGIDPNKFVIDTLVNPNNEDTDYSIRCRACGDYEIRILCDWHKNYDIDGMVHSVLDFTNKHRHGPQPVLNTAERFAAVVEYPQGYRKFRDV